MRIESSPKKDIAPKTRVSRKILGDRTPIVLQMNPGKGEKENATRRPRTRPEYIEPATTTGEGNDGGNGGFDLPTLHEEGDDREGLLAQAGRIERQATQLLEKPEWIETKLQFQIPFGPDHSLELSARTAEGAPELADRRDLFIFRNTSDGIRSGCCWLSLNKLDAGEVRGAYFEQEITPVLQANENMDSRVVRLVQDAGKLVAAKNQEVDQRVADQVTQTFAELLSEGAVNTRHGIWHQREDGSFVGVLHSSKEGDQKWDKVDTEPELHVRSQTDTRMVDYKKYRDGTFEIHDSNPDKANEARAVYGEDRVLETGGELVIFDLGDNKARRDVVDEAERAMGLRELQKERLDIIEKALAQYESER